MQNLCDVLKKYLYTLLLLLFALKGLAQQEFSLLHQVSGRYDFTFVGNTMNYAENGTGVACITQTSSSAELTLLPTDQIEKAYLYWSGSGNGDLEIKLNEQTIQAERHYNLTHSNLVFFLCFADVTQQVQTAGNGLYTVSELDVSSIISQYCPNATNYAGWSLVVLYKNEELPINQLNIYDGFKNVPNELTITLDNLNVIDNAGAKIGFIAWEGDSSIAVNETLRVNGNIIGNPPLNPINNAFNGTNSFTGSNALYNMDLDVYNIENYIQIGDTQASVQLTSGQDLVLISTVVTKLNSQLPDGEITLNDFDTDCDSQEVELFYIVKNTGTDVLPAGTPLAIYVNDIFLEITYTQTDLYNNESETGSVLVEIPENFGDFIQIHLVVDDLGNGTGEVKELNEDNNLSNILHIELHQGPSFNQPQNLTSCNLGNNQAVFDFSEYEFSIAQNDLQQISFYTSYQDAEQEINEIHTTSSYSTTISPTEIFVRIQDENCFSITSFLLVQKKCPPVIFNGISANGDTVNDVFLIEGLYNIFTNFELFVYSRWGELIWKGNNNLPMWDGTITEKKGVMSSLAPEGTYFYILHLNDSDYPDPLQGYLYLTR